MVYFALGFVLGAVVVYFKDEAIALVDKIKARFGK
jgi:hypothetical protein